MDAKAHIKLRAPKQIFLKYLAHRLYAKSSQPNFYLKKKRFQKKPKHKNSIKLFKVKPSNVHESTRKKIEQKLL